jgi:hypothetical protein
MFFKRLLPLTLALLLPACSLRLNEEVKKNSITVNPVQSGCLAGSGPLFVRYFNGETKEEEVNAYWACLEKAIQTFTEHTQGASQEYFTGEELASFLTKYFLKGKAVNPALVEEAMLLKQGFLGGSSQHLTREELRQVLVLIHTWKDVSLRLRPYMPFRVKSFQDRNASPEEFEKAIEEFQAGVSELGKPLSGRQESYSFDRLAALLKELKSFMYGDQLAEELWIDSAIRWTTALRPAKQIFISPPKDEILASDWEKIYYLAPRYYGLYLKIAYYVQANKGNYTSDEGVARLERLFADSNQLFGAVLDNHPGGVISSIEINELLAALDTAKMLPVPLSTAQSFIRTLFGRVFSASGLGDSYTVTKANVDRAAEIFRFATEGLRAIHAVFEKSGTSRVTAARLAAFPTGELLKATALKNGISREAVSAVKNSSEVKTIFPGTSNVVFIPEKAPLNQLSADHLAKIHLLRTLNRLLLQAYGSKKTSVSSEEVETMADDIFPMLQSLRLVSEETRKSVSKRLLEASLFLYSSDGDQSVTMTEALELESLLLSTISRGRVLHKEMAEKCKATETDALGKPVIEPDCFRKTFLAEREAVWAYIPGFSRYFGQQTKEEQRKILDQMEKFLRKGRETGNFTQSDTYSFILLPYYVELLFSRFDADHNGLLENKEAELAYPVFQPFLAAKAAEHGLTSPEDHYALYMFLLAYQELPTEMKLTWVWRRYVTGAKKFRADRAQVVQIFEKLLSQ